MRALLALLLFASLVLAQAAPQLVVSVGHAGKPDLAAFAGRYLATGAGSNVAIIDLSSGLTISHLSHGSLVMALEASPGGDLLAVGSCGNAIHLWNVKTWTLVHRLALRHECASSLSFSPDGALLASEAYGCCPGGLEVWDLRTGHRVRALAPGSRIRNVVFSRDGRWLAGVDEKRKATVFEWPSGRELRAFEGLEMAGARDSRAVTSNDGRYLAWLGAGGLRLWDVSSGVEIPLPGASEVEVHSKLPDGPERRWTEHIVTATAVEFLDDGRLVYVDDEQMIAMRLPDGPQQILPLARAETKWSGHIGITEFRPWLKIRRDGLMLAGTRGSQTVVWDVAAARLRELTAPALTSPMSLKWSGSWIVAWADFEGGLRGWDDHAGKPVEFGTEIDSAASLAFRPDGTRVAVAGLSSIHVLDIAGRRTVASRELDGESGVAFSPDGSRLAFASSSESLDLFDANLQPLHRIATLDKYTDAEHVAFSPDGKWIAAGVRGSGLRVWPALASEAGVTVDAQEVIYGPQPPAFSADSRWLASFKRGSSLVIWTTGTWNVARAWTLSGTGRALAFAPEGSRLAIASDGEAAIWDANTGHRLVSFSTPGSAEMTEIAWSPDGRRVVTAADDGVLRFWRSSDGRLLASLYMLASGADWLLVAPDGRLDGSENALKRLIAWRLGGRVAPDEAQTRRHRVPGLWHSLSTTPIR
jgi:WD40 repeat protein